MGNLIQDLLAEDLNEIVTDIGHACTWKGTAYDCVISEPDMEADIETGGFMPEGSFNLKIPRAAFNAGAGPFPAESDRITYGGTVYRVLSPTNKNDSAYIRLVLTPK